ncbi:MAG: lipopolysaccharide transport periplasmic protein LptA [Gammaproteobacteria bacterium]|nr:lipopolysaccharide transport periplasmic protein LptA [Gammaproteobacteria bacterium]
MSNKGTTEECHNKKLHLLFAAFLLLPFTTETLAAPPGQGLQIQADRVDIQQQQGVSKYLGRVELTQDGLQLHADELIIYQSEKGIERISAQGSPTTFNQAPRAGQTEIRGQANKIEYRTEQAKIEFIEEAHLWKGNDQFSGAHIIYDLDKKQIQAHGDSDDESHPTRVRAILHPKKDGQLP